MNEKEWIKTINGFVKLNPKTNIYPKINKYNPSVFVVIKELFKSNLPLVNQNNYDEIFSNSKGQFLSGKEWIKLFIDGKNLDEYHLNLRRDYQKCKQQKLYEKLLADFFVIYYHNEKIVLIEATEINFDINTRTKLEKLRNYLEEKEWGIYFSELQKVMHEQIIQFLDWNGSLNFNLYGTLLKKKLEYYLSEIQLKSEKQKTTKLQQLQQLEKQKQEINNFDIFIKEEKIKTLKQQKTNFFKFKCKIFKLLTFGYLDMKKKITEKIKEAEDKLKKEIDSNEKNIKSLLEYQQPNPSKLETSIPLIKWNKSKNGNY